MAVVAIKGAIFIMLVFMTAWAGANLAHTAWLAYPQWNLIALGGAVGCAYALTDVLFRSREWLGLRRYDGPRRRMAWGPWR